MNEPGRFLSFFVCSLKISDKLLLGRVGGRENREILREEDGYFLVCRFLGLCNLNTASKRIYTKKQSKHVPKTGRTRRRALRLPRIVVCYREEFVRNRKTGRLLS
jgi:hypothetical protein